MRRLAIAALLAALCGPAQAADTTPHKSRFVPVDKDVRLEVLDWGGSGTPLLFLAGWGSTAHSFDGFAPRFTAHHHVYGITRRGAGLSGHPPPTLENYDADRLADDVLAVIDALKLDRPVLVGHSMAGEEMSSIAVRHPEKVSGLIYLEAAYAFAYYAPGGGYTVQVEADDMRRDLEALMRADSDPAAVRALIDRIEANIPALRHSLDRARAAVDGTPEPPTDIRNTAAEMAAGAMRAGRRKYTHIALPVLAVIAVPYDCKADCDRGDQKAWGEEIAAQANAFEKGNPGARIVRLAHARHDIFRSNPDEVEQAMTSFMDGLKP